MRENFDEAFSLVIKHEGGYVNNPKDPGGMTNLGVTKKVWEEYVGHEVDEITMRHLSIDDVKPLYKKLYWDKIRGDDLPEGLDYAAFDFSSFDTLAMFRLLNIHIWDNLDYFDYLYSISAPEFHL